MVLLQKKVLNDAYHFDPLLETHTVEFSVLLGCFLPELVVFATQKNASFARYL